MAINDTQKQIIETALDCFMKYGFSKTSMSMIGEYSGFSRVTVHKYFKNKSLLFRSVVDGCLKETVEEAQSKTERVNPDHPWQMIEEYLIAIGRTVFDNVDDDRVLKDLHDTLYEIAEDIVEEKKRVTVDFIRHQLDRGIEHGLIDLQAVKMDSEQLAYLVDYGFSGIMRNAPVKEIKNQLHNFIRIYRKATEKSQR